MTSTLAPLAMLSLNIIGTAGVTEAEYAVDVDPINSVASSLCGVYESQPNVSV